MISTRTAEHHLFDIVEKVELVSWRFANFDQMDEESLFFIDVLEWNGQYIFKQMYVISDWTIAKIDCLILVGVIVFYVCISLYLFGDLAIYGSAVPKSIRDVIWYVQMDEKSLKKIVLSFSTYKLNNSANMTKDDLCWSSSSLTRHHIYQIFVVRSRWWLNDDLWKIGSF